MKLWYRCIPTGHGFDDHWPCLMKVSSCATNVRNLNTIVAAFLTLACMEVTLDTLICLSSLQSLYILMVVTKKLPNKLKYLQCNKKCSYATLSYMPWSKISIIFKIFWEKLSFNLNINFWRPLTRYKMSE